MLNFLESRNDFFEVVFEFGVDSVVAQTVFYRGFDIAYLVADVVALAFEVVGVCAAGIGKGKYGVCEIYLSAWAWWRILENIEYIGRQHVSTHTCKGGRQLVDRRLFYEAFDFGISAFDRARLNYAVLDCFLSRYVLAADYRLARRFVCLDELGEGR